MAGSSNPLKRRAIFDSLGNALGSYLSGAYNGLASAVIEIPEITIVERVSANLTYYASTYTLDAAETDQVWKIWRVIKIGSTDYKQYANNNGLYNKRWDQRSTYFPNATFTNTTSLFFNGGNNLVSFGDTHLYDVGAQWSMSFWLWVDNNALQRCIYSKTTPDANVYGLSFQITTAGKLFCQVRAPGFLTSHTGLATIPTQQWTHFCATYNGGANLNGFRFYFDGVLGQIPGSAALGASILQNQTAMIGARGAAGTFPFSGYMDEISMWGRALTEAEVLEVYNSGSPGNLSAHSQYAFLNSYYSFEGDSPGPTIADIADAADGTMINMNGAANFSSNVP